MVSWDTTGIQSGTYTIRFLSNSFTDEQEIVLRKG